MESIDEMLIIFFLILLNGIFAGAEIAILTAKASRLEPKARAGKTSAKIALGLAGDVNRFLSTVQVGITLVGTLAATYGGVSLVNELAGWFATVPIAPLRDHGHAIALGLVSAGIAFLSLVFGELVPKRLALRAAESVALAVAYPMYLLSIVARPAVELLGWVTSGVLAIVSFFGFTREQKSRVTAEDIQYLIETGTQQGVFDVTEQRVAMEALQLGDRRVREIMRPRVDMEALDVSMPADQIVGAVAMSGFSRLPVYEGSLDHIIGFVYIKDVLQQVHLRRPIELRKIMHPPVFVPDSLPLDRLLAKFQERHTQLAIALDEYGGTEGMVTVEDVLEELVGDIHDEHRRDSDQLVVAREQGGWLVDGLLSIKDLIELLGKHGDALPVPDDVSTISGLILRVLERLPSIGETVNWEGVHLEVVDMDGPRIDRIAVTIPSAPAEAGDTPVK